MFAFKQIFQQIGWCVKKNYYICKIKETSLKDMEFTAKQISEFVQGKVEGNENATVHTFAKIEEGVNGAISFLSNPKYTHYIYDTKSSIVLIDENVELEHSVETTLIRVKNA